VVAVEGLLSELSQDALDRLVRRDVAAGETLIFPGLPFIAPPAVDLLQ
jgi:hypothetical protein